MKHSFIKYLYSYRLWDPVVEHINRSIQIVLQYIYIYICGGTWRRSWLSDYATSWKVAGWIPDGVIGIFHWHNPTGRTVALGLTRSVAEMSTRNISWGWRWAVRRADNLTTFMCRLSWNLGASTSWNPLDTSGL